MRMVRVVCNSNESAVIIINFCYFILCTVRQTCDVFGTVGRNAKSYGVLIICTVGDIEYVRVGT